MPSSTGTLGVARGLRAFPFALDSTGWLSALRKSVSTAAVLRPWPRPHPRTIGFLGFQPIDFAERRVRDAAGRRAMRDARALDPDERVARGRIDHVATASCHHRAHRAAPIASSRAHPARHPRRNIATQPYGGLDPPQTLRPFVHRTHTNTNADRIVPLPLPLTHQGSSASTAPVTVLPSARW